MALAPPDHKDSYTKTNPELSDVTDASPKRKTSASPSTDNAPAEKRMKHSNGSGLGREDRFVYGNPKDLIKRSPPNDTFDTNSVLDLSCKAGKPEEDKTKPNDVTYHNYPRTSHQPYLPDPFARSNLEIKLVNSPKRPSPAEQLHIAKLQQQQRRSVQQQQKMLQQMRRSLDPNAGRSSSKSSRDTTPETSKEEAHSTLGPPAFPHNPHQPPPFMDNVQGKDLPDGHPVLPLLDPVYFSALYNAHGFMPPSSPSIAAAFIGTLQDALPKLSMMFPPTTSAAGSSLLHQKSGDNLN